MHFIKKERRKFSKKSYTSFILGGDMGGTNTNLGLFGIKNKLPILLVSFHFKSKQLKDLYSAIGFTIGAIKNHYKIKITKACLAVPGVVSHKKDSANITKLGSRLSGKAIRKKTGLKKIVFLNDFEAIGYGINLIKRKNIKVIKKAKKVPKANMLVIGAGTGLGKSLMVFDEHAKFYKPLPSEAGHMDLAAQKDEELNPVQFIRKYKKIKGTVSYEQVLSGNGITNIYLFLKSLHKYKDSKYTKEIAKSNSNPELISKYRKLDETCGKTFNIFRDNYAKFARNLAVDCFPRGGVYIAGGIAPKNIGIFGNEFVKIFEGNHDNAEVLRKIPVYIVLKHDAGLLGAGFAGAKFLM